MYFGQKSLRILFIAAAISLAGCMPTRVRVSDSHTMDEARARLILKTVPGFDMSQVWFATGAEYWNSGTCLDGRDIYVFTKPQPSSQGIWRGKKLYVRQPTIYPKAKCTDPDVFNYDPGFAITTVTFTDPERLNLEEAWDGAEPGLFEVRTDITDDELRRIASTLAEAQACLKKQAVCAYSIEHTGRMNWDSNELIRGLDAKNLLTLDREGATDKDKSCYSMVMVTGNWDAFGTDICYKNGVVSKFDAGGEVIE